MPVGHAPFHRVRCLQICERESVHAMREQVQLVADVFSAQSRLEQPVCSRPERSRPSGCATKTCAACARKPAFRAKTSAVPQHFRLPDAQSCRDAHTLPPRPPDSTAPPHSVGAPVDPCPRETSLRRATSPPAVPPDGRPPKTRRPQCGLPRCRAVPRVLSPRRQPRTACAAALRQAAPPCSRTRARTFPRRPARMHARPGAPSRMEQYS